MLLNQIALDAFRSNFYRSQSQLQVGCPKVVLLSLIGYSTCTT